MIRLNLLLDYIIMKENYDKIEQEIFYANLGRR